GRSSVMAQVNETQNVVPNIQDKRKPAPGVLPKNVQTWIVLGLTAIIMLMLWISGPAKGTKSLQKTDTPKTETVVGLSPAEISSRFDQQANPANDPNAGIGNQGAASPTEQDPIKQDLKLREYMARFASNVSLSYRSSQDRDAAKRNTDPASQLAMDLSSFVLPGSPASGSNTISPQVPQPSVTSIEQPSKKS